MKQRKYLILAFLVGAAACSNSSDNEMETFCQDVTCPDQAQAFEEVTAFSTCQSCHSSSVTNRQGAPTGLNFDSSADVLDQKGEVVEEVAEGKMPPEPYASSFTQNQRDEIITWVCCNSGS